MSNEKRKELSPRPRRVDKLRTKSLKMAQFCLLRIKGKNRKEIFYGSLDLGLLPRIFFSGSKGLLYSQKKALWISEGPASMEPDYACAWIFYLDKLIWIANRPDHSEAPDIGLGKGFC
jgi:hypothetical protein